MSIQTDNTWSNYGPLDAYGNDGTPGVAPARRQIGFRLVKVLTALASLTILVLVLLDANHPGGIDPLPFISINQKFLVVVAFPAAFILAFANGANDCANSVGTTVGAGAMTVRQALIADCIFEAAGAITMGPSVASTISSGEIHSSKWEQAPDYFALLMLAVLVGSGSTTLLATMYGLPISATHGVISGVIACALVSETTSALTGGNTVEWWPGFGMTVIGWVASPVVGMLAGMAVSLAVHRLVLGAANPPKAARQRQPVLLGGTIAISALFLLLKGPEQLSDLVAGRAWLAAVIAVLTGAAVAASVVAYKHVMVGGLGGLARKSQFSSGSTNKTYEDEVPVLGSFGSGLHADEYSNGSSSGTDHSAFDDVQQPFVPLLIAAGLTVAFAHGGNDIGNAMGPLSTIMYIKNKDKVPGDDDDDDDDDGNDASFYTALVVTVAAFLVGILALGSRTIATVGSSITELTPSRSFATQTGAAVAVLSSSAMNLPVSTSHCLVGAVVGVNFMERWCHVEGAKPLDLQVLKKIVVGWVVTIPLAATVSVLVLVLFQRSFLKH